jgi:hypothetical protein
MAEAFRFICNSCGKTIESWDEGHPYYFDKRGRKKYAYHPNPKRDQCIGVDPPPPVLGLCRELLERIPSPQRPMPELFLHLDLRHLPPAWATLPVLQKGQIRVRPQLECSILAFRLAFGLKRADVGQRLLCRQLNRTVRETEISLIPEPVEDEDIAEMPH